MSEVQVLLSTEERDLLLRLLETALGDPRAGPGRPDLPPEVRNQPGEDEGLMRGLVEKLRPVPIESA
jgi:hypothetical protein